MRSRLVLTTLLFLISAPGHAEDEQWSMRITPYLWAASLDTRTGQFGLPAVKGSASFSDIFDHLDLAFMGVVEARRGRFGLMVDLFQASLSDSVSVKPIPPIELDASLSSRTRTALLAAQYRIAEKDGDYVDLIGGVRFWSQRSRLRIDLPLNLRINRTENRDWHDPMVGFKGLYHTSPRTYLMGWVMAGGLGNGVKSSSDFMGAFGYRFSEHATLLVGYRHLSVDYSRGRFSFDTTLHGPAIGLDYRF